MRRTSLACLTIAALALPAPAAFAQTPADRADVRCALVLTAVARDPKNRDSAIRGTFYYLGRLEGRGPAARLEALMLSEGRAMTSAQTAQSELTRCVAELNGRGAAFQATLRRVQQQAGPPAGKGAPAVK